MENGLYTAHEVAVIIADLFGDNCACNFNGIDEWLPFKCELLDACPNPCGVACWEQYLKYRHCKNEMEAKEEWQNLNHARFAEASHLYGGQTTEHT